MSRLKKLLSVIGLVSVFFMNGFAFAEDKVPEFDGCYVILTDGKFIELNPRQAHMTYKEGTSWKNFQNRSNEVYYVRGKKNIISVDGNKFIGIAWRDAKVFHFKEHISIHPLVKKTKAECILPDNIPVVYAAGRQLESRSKSLGEETYYFKPKNKLIDGEYVVWLGEKFYLFKIGSASQENFQRKVSDQKSVSGKDSINSNSNFISEQKEQQQAQSHISTSNQLNDAERQELKQLRAEKTQKQTVPMQVKTTQSIPAPTKRSKAQGKVISSSDKDAIIHTARVEKMIDLPDESGIKVSMMSIDTGGSTDVSATEVIFFTLYKRGEEYSTDASFELGYFFSLKSAKKIGNGIYRFVAKSASKTNEMPVITTFDIDARDAIFALDSVKCNGHMDCPESTNFKTTIKLFGEHEKQNHEVQAKNTVNTFSQEKTFNKETTTYYARISQKDHLGKRGQKLKDAGTILQQDRANYHKYYKRDREDRGDSRFGTRDNRDKIKRMLARGSTSKNTLDAIRYGTPLVKVKIYQNHIDVTLESKGSQSRQRQQRKRSTQRTTVPVMIGGEADMDACGATGVVQGISRRGDGFVAVRSGPGTKYKMIDKLYRNGEHVTMCDHKGKWVGVVYGRNCGVGTPISRRKPYEGSCKSGWVYEKYIRMTAG